MSSLMGMPGTMGGGMGMGMPDGLGGLQMLGSAPLHADAAKAYQGAVEEMTKAVTSQVKK